MAGDWIKIEHWTQDKPEVFRMAESLGCEPDAVVGKLVRIWVWADQQTIDGRALSVTGALLDRVAGRDGFAIALESVGWIVRNEVGFSFVNFDRHNGQTAKERALNAKRAQKSRSRKCHGEVTAASRSARYQEKRREEKNTTSTNVDVGATSLTRFVKPTVEEVRAYCVERANGVDAGRFVDFYESKGWLVGRNPMKNWKAAVRNWEGRQGVSSTSSTQETTEEKSRRIAMYEAAVNDPAYKEGL